MTDQQFENLLKRMPTIAEAVNGFNSEAVQAQAFDALMSALLGDQCPSPISRGAQHDNQRKEEESSAKARSGRGARAGRSGSRRSAEIMHELDLAPKGKTSFTDFVADKQPTTNEEKYAVVVYYLEQVLKLPAISEHHVSTVFRMAPGWREPEDIWGGLKMTARRTSTIDTSDRTNIKTTPHGRNFVEHDLPAKPKSK